MKSPNKDVSKTSERDAKKQGKKRREISPGKSGSYQKSTAAPHPGK